MKKFLLILGMITCMLGVTACQKTEPVQLSSVDQKWVDDNMRVLVDSVIPSVVEGMSSEEMITMREQYPDQVRITDAQIALAQAYEAAMPELGDYQAIEKNEFSEKGTVLTIVSTIICSERKATVEVIMDQEGGFSCTVNPIYSFGETMAKAGLNTLMGMGTVFIVLILIALLISSFGLISKIQNAGKKKEKATESAVANAVAQIVENEEAQEDDLELIAVIAAAIAASEGAASADGYVVRSIRKIR